MKWGKRECLRNGMKNFSSPNNSDSEVIDESVAYNYYAILSVERKNSLVSKSKETTRSHPEHGRKDLLQ